MAKINKRILPTWDTKKFSTLPAEIESDMQFAFIDFAQRLDTAVSELDDLVQNGGRQFREYMESSRDNLEAAEFAFEELVEQIQKYQKYVLSTRDTLELAQFVDGKAVNTDINQYRVA